MITIPYMNPVSPGKLNNTKCMFQTECAHSRDNQL